MATSKVISIEPNRGTRNARSAERSLDQSVLRNLIGYNLRRADLLMRQHLVSTLSDWGLRPAEYSALVLIANNNEVTPGDLGLALDIKRPNMVTLVTRLERRDLIKREVHHQDRRSQILTLTPKGEAMLADVEELVFKSDQVNTGCWSKTEREEFIRLLQMLIDGRWDNKSKI